MKRKIMAVLAGIALILGLSAAPVTAAPPPVWVLVHGTDNPTIESDSGTYSMTLVPAVELFNGGRWASWSAFIQCPRFETYSLRLTLAEGRSRATGSASGYCSGKTQRFVVRLNAGYYPLRYLPGGFQYNNWSGYLTGSGW